MPHLSKNIEASHNLLCNIATFNKTEHFISTKNINKHISIDIPNGSHIEKQIKDCINNNNDSTYNFAWIKELGHGIIEEIKFSFAFEETSTSVRLYVHNGTETQVSENLRKIVSSSEIFTLHI